MTADTYGSTVTIPVITVDAKGRVTAVTNTGINFGTATVQQAQTIQTQARSVSADHFISFVDSNNATSGSFESLFTKKSTSLLLNGVDVISISNLLAKFFISKSSFSEIK